ncbi:MAG: DCC1-like thiol-disulfide oxidoreductase family protein [Planctomycetota bacterium]
MSDADHIPRSLLLFDGECGLCTRSVRFVLDRDRVGRLRFGSLQSDLGRRVLVANGLDPDELSSLVLVDAEGRVWTRSDAALRVSGDLGWPWSWGRAFLVVPRFLRDGVYDVIARNRIRWFGTADACELPAPGAAERFVG